MQETKITKDRIRNHFTYGWWKYVLVIGAAIFGWNMIYTSSAYKPPREKRLDITFVTYALPDEVTAWIHDETMARYPEIEDSTIISIVYTPDDNYYGNMQLTTYAGAAEGDIYIMPRERFQSFAQSAAFEPLDDAIADGTIRLGDIDVTRTTVTSEDGVRAIYGIPAESLYGMMEYGIDNRDLVICIMSYSPNIARALDWVDWWIDEMRAPKPDWLVEQEAKTPGITEGVSDISSF